MPAGYLITYKDDGWRDELGRYTFDLAPGFTPWPASQHDRLSSFSFKLPVGWDLRIHEHRDSASRCKVWRGSGAEVRVDRDELPGFLHDEASGHSWVRLNYASIPQAFAAVQPEGPTPLRITRPDTITLPTGYQGDTWHQQGIQRTTRGELLVSGSAPEVGYLYCTDTARTIVTVVTPRYGDCNHLGGFQVAGNILAVGYEHFEHGRNGTSIILFYDIADITAPVALEHLTITRGEAGSTAGAVALIALADCWLALVANWDAARLDFYISTSLNLHDRATRFSPAPRWRWSAASQGLGVGSIDHNWGAYQNINLFAQPNTTPRLADLWFVGTHTNRGLDRKDWADLYHLRLGADDPVVTKEGKKHFVNSGDGQHFTYAAGYYYDPAVNAFEVYAAEARLHDGTTSRVDRWL